MLRRLRLERSTCRKRLGRQSPRREQMAFCYQIRHQRRSSSARSLARREKGCASTMRARTAAAMLAPATRMRVQRRQCIRKVVIWDARCPAGHAVCGQLLQPGGASPAGPALAHGAASATSAGQERCGCDARPLAEIARSPPVHRGLRGRHGQLWADGFLMTAAPMAMVGCGHSVGEAAMGIQWHVLAMFVPSFFTGKLIARFWQAPHRGSGHADDCHGQHACLAGSGAVSLSGAR